MAALGSILAQELLCPVAGTSRRRPCPPARASTSQNPLEKLLGAQKLQVLDRRVRFAAGRPGLSLSLATAPAAPLRWHWKRKRWAGPGVIGRGCGPKQQGGEGPGGALQ